MQNEEFINLDKKKEEDNIKKEETKKAAKAKPKPKKKEVKKTKEDTTNDSSDSEAEDRKAAYIRKNNINVSAPRSDKILFTTKSVFKFALDFIDHDLVAESNRAKIVIQDRSKIEEDHTIRSLCYFENNNKFKIV